MLPSLVFRCCPRTRHSSATADSRRQLGAKGILANQWLVVAEANGAADSRAVGLAYSYMAALDMAKWGAGTATHLQLGARLDCIPTHLREQLPHRPERFETVVDSVLARLQRVDGSGSLPECEVMDTCLHMAHPDYQIGGPKFKSVMEPILKKWEKLYEEYRAECRERLPKGSGWSDTHGRIWHRILEKYRDILIGDRSYEEYTW